MSISDAVQLDYLIMQGAGNRILVVDGRKRDVEPPAADVLRRLADPATGPGFDQLMWVGAAQDEGLDAAYRIFNADGSEVEQCGNGARCFARFVRDQGLTEKTEIPVGTRGGDIRLYVEGDGEVRVNMGIPDFAPARIPFDAESEADHYALDLDGETLNIGAVSMGNPHAVLLVDDVKSAPVSGLGPLIECHRRFPRRVNAGFMQVLDPAHIRLRVYERGSGETLACGTGACAAVSVGRRWGLLGEEVTVSLPGGELRIRWPGEGEALWMIGPAVTVFEGSIEI